jgi:hypothetical protein
MDLTEEQRAKLARLSNRATKYELTGTNSETGAHFLFGYSRKGRAGLLSMLQKNAAMVAEFCGSNAVDFEKRASAGASIGVWRFAFSGRTQREAIQGGELPFFVDALEASRVVSS